MKRDWGKRGYFGRHWPRAKDRNLVARERFFYAVIALDIECMNDVGYDQLFFCAQCIHELGERAAWLRERRKPRKLGDIFWMLEQALGGRGRWKRRSRR